MFLAGALPSAQEKDFLYYTEKCSILSFIYIITRQFANRIVEEWFPSSVGLHGPRKKVAGSKTTDFEKISHSTSTLRSTNPCLPFHHLQSTKRLRHDSHLWFSRSPSFREDASTQVSSTGCWWIKKIVYLSASLCWIAHPLPDGVIFLFF